MLTALGEEAGFPIGPAAARRVAEENARKTVWRVVNPDAAGIGSAMKSRGYRVGVISNSDGSVAAVLDECGFGGQFETIIDSAVVGVAKPDPEIFRIATEAMGVDAGETAYVGDIPSVDVTGARASGILPILYDRCGVYRELAERERIRRISSLGQLLD
jgi:putative hydrolase of the HAD superfamily